MEFIILEAILLFLFQSKSRHNGNYKFRKNKKIIKHVNNYLKTNAVDMTHVDNIEKIFKKLSVENLDNLLQDIIKKLIRSKKINSEKFLLLDEYYMIAIDMTTTQKFNSNNRNGKIMSELLFQKVNEKGEKVYYRRVVEAKLILRNKLTITVMSEFVRNEDTADGEYVKQDCELKAAYRLMDRLKCAFKRLNICLLLDGLYPNETVFQKCEDYNWKYIMTLKEDKLPKLYNRFKDLRKVKCYEEKKKIISKKIYQRLKLMNNLSYRDFKINIFEVREYVEQKGLKYKNLFITNIEITKGNVALIAEGGRLRWKQEHSFHKQKNLYFNMTHIYSIDENASQCWHIILQIADLIFQFMAYSYNYDGKNILYEMFKSILGFLQEIYNSFREEPAKKDEKFDKKQLILLAPV